MRGQRSKSRLVRYCCYGPALALFGMVVTSSRCTNSTGITDLSSAAAGLAPLRAGKSTAKETRLIDQAESDPVGLLEKGLQWHDTKLRDYEGTFHLQELRDGGASLSAVCRFKFRSDPFSLAMWWLRGAGRIDRLLYVAGLNDGQMIVHPTGLTGRLLGAVAVDPGGKMARKGGTRPITEFGMRNALVRILESFRRDAGRGALRSRCLGLGMLEGRRVLTLEKLSTDGKLIVDLLAEALVPVRIRRFAADGQLTAFYQYSGLRFNRGFTDTTFSPAAVGLAD